MSDLAIFRHQGADIRTAQIDGEVWFVAADVCDYFGVTNRNRVMQGIDEDEKGGTQIDTPGGKQTVAVLSEPGLYSLLFSLQPSKARGVTDEQMQARLEQVRTFRRWVTHTVIPEIRKTRQLLRRADRAPGLPGRGVRESDLRAWLVARGWIYKKLIGRRYSESAGHLVEEHEYRAYAKHFDAFQLRGQHNAPPAPQQPGADDALHHPGRAEPDRPRFQRHEGGHLLTAPA